MRTLVTPEPLPLETRIDRRFEVLGVIGQGPLGIVYLAQDLQAEVPCVVKELAPYGTKRLPSGHLEWTSTSDTSRQASRLFVEDAERARSAHPPRVPLVRAAFQAFGTAYQVRAYDADLLPLQTLLDRGEPLGFDATLDILMQLIETLERSHAKRLLHRGLKPSNILLSPGGEAHVVDFGVTRDWLHDRDVLTPDLSLYAAPEQRATRQLRGPATDVYGLAAIAHAAAYGIPPNLDPLRPSLPPIAAALLPDSHRRLAKAIELGLSAAMPDRPPTASALRAMLVKGFDEPAGTDSVASLDSLLARTQRLRFAPNESPGGGVLNAPKALRLRQCPVCRLGRIALRPIAERLCPECRVGILHLRTNQLGRGPCPTCRLRTLVSVSRNPLRKTSWRCSCGATYDGTAQALQRTGTELVHTYAEWLALADRTALTMVCDGCAAQLDVDGDRWRRIGHKGELSRYPDEWARIAAGLKPDCGNATCPACAADFHVEGEWVTTLDAQRDPFGFFERHAGRPMLWEDLRWVGAGKESGRPGLTCDASGTEFDTEQGFLRLVRTNVAALRKHVGKLETLEDWHRLAQGLPLKRDQDDLVPRLREGLRAAYRQGLLDCDGWDWRGRATRVEAESDQVHETEGQLAIGGGQLAFGGLLRKLKIPLDAVAKWGYDGASLIATLKDDDVMEWVLDPFDWTVALESGKHTIELTTEDLAARLNALARAP